MTTILFNKDENGVATLTLNRPEKHNAFDGAMIKLFREYLSEVNRDDSVRCVILNASGKHFCAGADFKWMQAAVNYSEQENYKDSLELANLMYDLYHLSKPTIAVVHGAAFGGGIGLTACADIAVASHDAYFCLSEVKIGLVPAVIAPYVIAAMGERITGRYFLTAEKFSAEVAKRDNLIHEVCEAPMDYALELGGAIAKNKPGAMSAAKELLRTLTNKPINSDTINSTAKFISKIRVSEEAQAGLREFLRM